MKTSASPSRRGFLGGLMLASSAAGGAALVAVPALARTEPAHPDQALLDLGKELDAALARLEAAVGEAARCAAAFAAVRPSIPEEITRK